MPSVKLAHCLLIAFLTLVVCEGQVVKQSDPQTTPERVKVDDGVIDSNDYIAVIDPVWWLVSIYDGPAKYEADLKQFSRPQRYVFAVAWHIAEVNNGGHDQFYSNSTGIVWRDALAGYKAMGLDEVAAILRQSADLLGGNPSLDREQRNKQLDSRSPNFEKLDNRFYKLQENPKFEKTLMDYIKTNRTAFYFDGLVPKPKMPDIKPPATN